MTSYMNQDKKIEDTHSDSGSTNLQMSKKSSSSMPETPLSIQLESEALRKHQKSIPFRTYLENGYKDYRTWLSMTLGSNFSQHLNFCIARNMNRFKSNSMGVDLEIRYLIKKLENLFGPSQMPYYEKVIRKTLRENLDLSEAHIASIVDDYMRNPRSFDTMLSDQEFNKRLSQVSTNDLDLHSYKIWRNSNHVELNSKVYPITVSDIQNGESICPASSKHLGIQNLELNGYLPVMTNVRAPKQHGVTFI